MFGIGSKQREGNAAIMSGKEIADAKQLLEDIGLQKKHGIIIIQEIIEADSGDSRTVTSKGIVCGSASRMAISHILVQIMNELKIKKSLVIEALLDES